MVTDGRTDRMAYSRQLDILAVMSKYLQMLVINSIFKEDPDQVADNFQRFNRDFDQTCQAFIEVTHPTFNSMQGRRLRR